MIKLTIPFDPQLSGIENIAKGKHGIIFAHGERSSIESGILPTLSKKLYAKNISSILFNFPFRMKGVSQVDSIEVLDQAFLAVWHEITRKHPEIIWSVGGHDIGADTAIRISSLTFNESRIPSIVGLSYPMYPPNRPELVNTISLGAIMGDALFCQGDKSNRGTYDRLRNQVKMMAQHAQVKKIGGANHQLEVLGKPIDIVANWIARDIENFLKDLS
ncbi:MAG: alpha/beta family hydrolase [Candidatus Kariarchaeaceae archaeon]|jgi:predicted alpha/beta-hydrolase family hydrolase